jgi:Amt family ammonium transporter
LNIFLRRIQVFASHAIGGMVGNVLTALFAQSSVASADGSTPIAGGWLDRHWVQLGYQIADSCAGFGYSFVMTVCYFNSSCVRIQDLICF